MILDATFSLLVSLKVYKIMRILLAQDVPEITYIGDYKLFINLKKIQDGDGVKVIKRETDLLQCSTDRQSRR